MASYPPPIQTLLISYFNPNNFINLSAFDYTKTDTRYLKKNGDTSYGTIIAPNFTGLASSATNSTNINLTNEVLQNSGCLIPFSITATGNQPLKTNSSLKFNPSTGIFTTDFISTTASITSGSAMTATGAFTANSTSSLVGATTATGLITANGGLTMGGDTKITLGSGATAPTAGTQLGYSVVTQITGTPSITSSIASYSNFTLVNKGVYLLTYAVTLGSWVSTTTGYAYAFFGTTNNSYSNLTGSTFFNTFKYYHIR